MTAHEITLKVGSPHQLRDHILRAAGHCTPGGSVRHTLDDLLAQVEAQLPKPAIEEPTAFGSIVRATEPHGRRLCWQIDERSGKHYWQANDGTVEVWSELTDVEVLRVGLGVADEDKLAAAWRDGHHEGLGADIDKVREEAWNDGAREMNTQIHQGVSGHLENAIGAERKNALERVLTLVEELAP